MSGARQARSVVAAAQRRQREQIRLDLAQNPYGPSLAVYEALSSARCWEDVDQESVCRLRRRLAAMIGVPSSWLLLGNGIDELLDAIFLWRRDRGPLVLFPPASQGNERRAHIHRVPVIPLQRTAGFALALDVETAADLPPHCWAIVESPNDPSGTLVEPLDAVRLARATDLLVIDERHGAYSGRSMVPLVREFEHIIVLQTMETWAALGSFPVAYAVGPPPLIQQLNAYRARDELTAGGLIAATATLQDLSYMQATVQRVRQERSRLFRTLRKLNMVSPCSSWANFMPARVERGTAPRVVDGLAERGIRVYQPPQPELSRVLRISAGRPEHTDALKQALIEIGLEL